MPSPTRPGAGRRGLATPTRLWHGGKVGRPFARTRRRASLGPPLVEIPAMSRTIVACSHPGCQEPAAYKIAAPWSDGSFSELKTYGHACADHLGAVFREAEQRRRAYKPSPGETVEEIGIYRYEQGKRDRQLQRLWGLEENYRS